MFMLLKIIFHSKKKKKTKGKGKENQFGPCHCVCEATVETLCLSFNGNLTIYTVFKLTEVTLK